MGGIDVEAEYLSVGANRQTAATDWNHHGVLAFGADNNVCLWKPAVGIISMRQHDYGGSMFTNSS
jgi:hypothetical protein